MAAIAAPATVTDLSIDDDSGLVATGHARPRLSWKLSSGAPDLRQEAYEIEVAASPSSDGPVERSGLIRESRPYLAPWPAKPLRSREARWWRVRVRTNRGLTPWSSASRVEASLLEPSDWTARPISPASNVGRLTAGPVPLLRREFFLARPVAKARLYVSAFGVHAVQLNGRPISGDLLEPGWTVYPKRLLFAAYDVADQLRRGPNVVSAAIGDGWFRGDLTVELQRNNYGATTALLAQLEVTLEGGEVVVVASDGRWRGGYGEIRRAELYHGSEIDLASEPAGWRTARFDDSTWEPVSVLDLPIGLETRSMPAVRVVESREIKLPARSADEPIRIDTGQNMTGYLRVRARGPAGAQIAIRHAEVLDNDGSLFTTSLRKARATDTYVLDGGPARELQPAFTFHGFRYAEIEASPGVEIEVVSAEVMSSDLTRTGRFACSDARVNRLFDNVVWSQRGNFLALPTDCPQRDERLGWTGDIQVFAATACMNADCRTFLRSWLRDLVLEQREDGSVSATAPNLSQGSRMEFGAAGWGDAATLVPWDLYRAYGDLELLREQFPSMRAWVDWVASRTEPDGTWTRDPQFGDWLDPDAPPRKPWKAKAHYGFVATAYLSWSAGAVARVAALFADTAAARHYAALQASAAQAAWDRWGEDMALTPTGCALAIEFGIAPADMHGRLGAQLAAIVAANRDRIGTGFLGTPLILPALTRTGQIETAYRLLLNPDCPGWLYQVDAGATTIWERWDALLPDGALNPVAAVMVSFNHYAYGAVAAWLYKSVAGLNVDLSQPPGEQVQLTPQPGADLTWAEAELQTPYGRLAIAWRKQAARLDVEVEVPAGAVARLAIPEGYRPDPDEDMPRSLGSGRHAFRLRASAPPIQDIRS